MITRIFLQLVCLFCLIAIPSVSLGTGLGGIEVKSALGEPLYAEIDLLGVSQEEAGSLMVKLATSDEYLTSGLSDSSVLREIRFDILQKDSGFKLLLRTRRPVNEPFLDLLIHLDSQTARLYRQYTLLLDPPLSVKSGEAESSANTFNVSPEGLTAIEPKPAAAPKAKKVMTPVVVQESIDPEAMPVKKKKKHKKTQPQEEIIAEASSQPSPSPAPASGETYLTKEGDIFGKVAQQYQPEGVRLKDVMAAFYRTNPEAFLNGDINQLKAGQLLKIPNLEELAQGKPKKPKAEIAKPVVNEAPDAKPAKIAEPKFVLKLSAGDESDKDAPIEPAKTIEATGAAEQKTIQPDIQNQPAPVAEPVVINPPVVPAAPVPPVVNVQPAANPVPPASVPASKSSYDLLMTSLLWITIALGAILAGGVLFFLFAMIKAKLQKRTLDSLVETGLINSSNIGNSISTLTSLKADDFASDEFLSNSAFHNTGFGHTSMDLHEVDPIIESEVYSAYGRHEQAVMILESAMKKAPGRHELKIALMKVYAEQNNTAAFESLFLDIQDSALQNKDDKHFLLTAIDLGLKLDPENPLYQFEDITKQQDQAELTAAEFFNVEEENAEAAELAASQETAESVEVEEITETEAPPVKPSPVKAVEPSIKFQKSSLSDDLKMLKENNVIEFEMIKIPEVSTPPEPEKTFDDVSVETITLDAPILPELEPEADSAKKASGKD